MPSSSPCLTLLRDVDLRAWIVTGEQDSQTRTTTGHGGKSLDTATQPRTNLLRNRCSIETTRRLGDRLWHLGHRFTAHDLRLRFMGHIISGLAGVQCFVRMPRFLHIKKRADMTAGRGTWGTRAGFILAAAGSAVGLGNIWGFPTQVGQGGGAAFVLIYLLCVAVICLPIMVGELAIGRRTHTVACGLLLNPQATNALVAGRRTGRIDRCRYSFLLQRHRRVDDCLCLVHRDGPGRG